MELIWSTAGVLGGVLAVLSEGADLVLIGDFMNAVHADQHVLEFCLPSSQRCGAFSSAACTPSNPVAALIYRWDFCRRRVAAAAQLKPLFLRSVNALA